MHRDVVCGYSRLAKLLVTSGFKELHKIKKNEIIKTFALKYGLTIGFPETKDGYRRFIKREYNDPNSPIYRGIVDANKNALSLEKKRKKNKPVKDKTKPKRKISVHREKYLAYLDSKEWKSLRNEIKTERGNKCEICHIPAGKGVILDGHHLTYVRLFCELKTDIQIVCRDCHKKIHKH